MTQQPDACYPAAMPRKTLPEVLKHRRMKLGRSLRRAAEIAGLSNPWLSRLENDDEILFLTMTWVTLHRVCKAYDVPFLELNKKLESIARRRRALS